VAATHYDFSQVEQSARNRAAVLDLVGGKKTVGTRSVSVSTTAKCQLVFKYVTMYVYCTKFMNVLWTLCCDTGPKKAKSILM